jgi:hypothetical protein
MVEHLLQTRLGEGVSELEEAAQRDFTTSDLFLDDFLLTHIIFMSAADLAQQLIDHYHHGDKDEVKDLATKHKRRVVNFVHSWIIMIQEPALEESAVANLIEVKKKICSSIYSAYKFYLPIITYSILHICSKSKS